MTNNVFRGNIFPFPMSSNCVKAYDVVSDVTAGYVYKAIWFSSDRRFKTDLYIVKNGTMYLTYN